VKTIAVSGHKFLQRSRSKHKSLAQRRPSLSSLSPFVSAHRAANTMPLPLPLPLDSAPSSAVPSRAGSAVPKAVARALALARHNSRIDDYDSVPTTPITEFDDRTLGSATSVMTAESLSPVEIEFRCLEDYLVATMCSYLGVTPHQATALLASTSKIRHLLKVFEMGICCATSNGDVMVRGRVALQHL
jgi:hypothetical protein